jgi:hypothetical protein
MVGLKISQIIRSPLHILINILLLTYLRPTAALFLKQAAAVVLEWLGPGI